MVQGVTQVIGMIIQCVFFIGTKVFVPLTHLELPQISQIYLKKLVLSGHLIKNLYTRKFFYEHFTPAFWLQNNLCEFITQEHKFKRWFYTKKQGWKFTLKFFDIQK